MKYSKRLQSDDTENMPKYLIGNILTSPFRMIDEITKKVLLFKKQTQLKLVKVCLLLTVLLFFLYIVLSSIFKSFDLFICTGLLFVILFYFVVLLVVKKTNEVPTEYRTGLEDDDNINEFDEEDEEDEYNENIGDVNIDDDDKGNNDEDELFTYDSGKSKRLTEIKEQLKERTRISEENFEKNGFNLCMSVNNNVMDIIKKAPEFNMSDEITASSDIHKHNSDWMQIYNNNVN